MKTKPYLVRKSYWKWIEDEAKRCGSDGCTKVTDWHRECCYEHDLACFYNKSPRSAYAVYCQSPQAHWEIWWANAEKITRRQADYNFGKCNLEWSPTRIGKIRSIIRFLGVRIGALLSIGVRQPKDLNVN